MRAKLGMTVLGLIIAAAIYLLIQPVPLASMRHTCSQPEANISAASFSGQAGDQIRFSLSSNVKGGLLDVSLLDSQGNVVKQFGQAKHMETSFALDWQDTYTLRAEYDGFTGSFSAAVYRVNH